jgi:guanine deaminase
VPNPKFMEIALKEAYRGLRKGDGGPFGACLVRGGVVVAVGHNEVLKTADPTRHAEVCAIQRAARKLGRPHFTGCELYSTTEPCVMCFAAINWAQIRRVYFGTSVRDVRRLGFNELVISNRRLKSLGGSSVEIEPRFMRAECQELLDFWSRLPGKKTY